MSHLISSEIFIFFRLSSQKFISQEISLPIGYGPKAVAGVGGVRDTLADPKIFRPWKF